MENPNLKWMILGVITSILGHLYFDDFGQGFQPVPPSPLEVFSKLAAPGHGSLGLLHDGHGGPWWTVLFLAPSWMGSTHWA